MGVVTPTGTTHEPTHRNAHEREQEETGTMKTFDTPGPIVADIDTGTGHVHIRAGERADTVVEVRPTDPSEPGDVEAAEEAQVDLVDGRLLVKVKRNKLRSLFGRPPCVDVKVDLPNGSEVSVSATTDVRCEGRLGNVVADTGAGSIQVEAAGRLRARTAAGDVTVGRTAGRADVTTSAGKIRIGEIDGAAVVRTSSGEIQIGTVTGDLRVNTAMGDIDIDRAGASVAAKTAFGGVRVGEVVQGGVHLETSFGGLEVGVREGTAAWLDVKSSHGTVRSHLEASDEPAPTATTVEIRGRTGFGDIVIRRSQPAEGV